MNDELKSKIAKIKVLAVDVDGVLTSGWINLDQNGNEIKMFHAHDGQGLVLMKKAGYKTAIITARASGAVTARAEGLNVDAVFQGAYPKLEAFKQLLMKLDVQPEEVCFVGDDLPDIGIFKRAGLAVAVANASDDVKKYADYITEKSGGHGAVREVVELILKVNGQWEEIIKYFLA